MKSLFLLMIGCGVFLGSLAIGSAETYKGKDFPPDSVLGNYFKIKSFTVIGKSKIGEDAYLVYFKIKTGPEVYTGRPILCSGTVRKLDTDIWIGEKVVIGTDAEILEK